MTCKNCLGPYHRGEERGLEQGEKLPRANVAAVLHSCLMWLALRETIFGKKKEPLSRMKPAWVSNIIYLLQESTLLCLSEEAVWLSSLCVNDSCYLTISVGILIPSLLLQNAPLSWKFPSCNSQFSSPKIIKKNSIVVTQLSSSDTLGCCFRQLFAGLSWRTTSVSRVSELMPSYL